MVIVDNFVNPMDDLIIENGRLREYIEVIQKKCADYDAEIQTLLRKNIKLLEEKEERLKIELRLVANLDGMEQM